MSVLGAPLLLVFWAVMTRVVLGENPVQGVPDARFRGWRFVQITAVQASLLLIYPAYQAIFMSVAGFLEMLIVSILPIINVALKNTLVACGSHLEDNLPEMVVLTVDGFSALYSVICMRGTNSVKMVAITVALNVVVMMLSLHGMNRRSRAARDSRAFQLMQLRQRQAQRTPSFLSAALAGGSPDLLSTLVITTLKLLQAPGQLDPAELREIRLLSGMQHNLSDANSALLKSLAARPIINDVLVATRKKNTKAVKQSLQLLFNNEYLGLIAYIQCIIPVLYMLYMPVLRTLPNRVYYPTHFVILENADQFLDRMTVIALLALLQLAALIVLHVFVATHFAVSTVYQIAFVLETHFKLVAGRLIVWFIVAVQSTLLHYGADFTFQFNWIHGSVPPQNSSRIGGEAA
ncbi:hypothetical protein PRNP1_004401 [Phytophthora ramorum]